MTTNSAVNLSPSHPGAIVREEILAPLNLTLSEAAEKLDVPLEALSDLLNETSALSPDMARRIELTFGVSAEMLLRVQTAWERRKALEELAALDQEPAYDDGRATFSPD
jgi:addiction module HigA family antidote